MSGGWIRGVLEYKWVVVGMAGVLIIAGCIPRKKGTATHLKVQEQGCMQQLNSGARCGLENVQKVMGFCVHMILAAQAAHPEPVWKSGKRSYRSIDIPSKMISHKQ